MNTEEKRSMCKHDIYVRVIGNVYHEQIVCTSIESFRMSPFRI